MVPLPQAPLALSPLPLVAKLLPLVPRLALRLVVCYFLDIESDLDREYSKTNSFVL